MADTRHIHLDWGDPDSGAPARWCLTRDDQIVASAPVNDWTKPPFVLTEGLRFVPEYRSGVTEALGEPDAWVYYPDLRAPTTRGFWVLIAVAVALMAASVRWPQAGLIALVIVALAVAREARP